MAEELQVSLLGGPEVILGTGPVTGFVSNKARALVYYLAATGSPHTRDALAGLLWSDVPDAAARKNLRDVLSNLRKLIGPYLSITRRTVSLNADAPDGTQIATASYDGTAKVWDAGTGEELFTLYGHKGPVTDLAFSPDGRRLYTASVDGTIRTYLLDIDDLLALAESRVTRSLTSKECETYLHREACPPLDAD